MTRLNFETATSATARQSELISVDELGFTEDEWDWFCCCWVWESNLMSFSTLSRPAAASSTAFSSILPAKVSVLWFIRSSTAILADKTLERTEREREGGSRDVDKVVFGQNDAIDQKLLFTNIYLLAMNSRKDFMLEPPKNISVSHSVWRETTQLQHTVISIFRGFCFFFVFG